MATLREIEADLLALENLLLEVGGDVSDDAANAAVDQWLEELGAARNQKLDGYATLIRDVLKRAEVRSEEAKRLAALAKTDEGVVARLKDRLRWFMETRSERVIQTALHRLTLALNGGKQAITITADVPAAYMRVVREVDLQKIRDELEAGKQLDFAKLEPRGKHVRIT